MILTKRIFCQRCKQAQKFGQNSYSKSGLERFWLLQSLKINHFKILIFFTKSC
jgi:hypothetical protein